MRFLFKARLGSLFHESFKLYVSSDIVGDENGGCGDGSSSSNDVNYIRALCCVNICIYL
jgi:hypothetical protein